MIKTYKLKEIPLEEILTREISAADLSVETTVRDIIADVKSSGDEALFRLTEKYDGVKLSSLEVTKEEIENALSAIPKDFLETLLLAKKNIERFHSKQLRYGYKLKDACGYVGQRVLPLETVGLYVPGGTAAYPSSVLMNAIPAKIAGVKNIVMVTPVSKSGTANADILATASIVGVSKIFKIGGAQAIAALAYGTKSVPKVDKIVGPGNAFVAEAKRQVFGEVSIDMIAGPSEILIIADENNDPSLVSADMLSQAEHDKKASAVLLTPSEKLAKSVALELEKQLETLPRAEFARVSIDGKSKIIVTESILQAIDVSNKIAPEHLEICVNNAEGYLNSITNAGSVFLGRFTPEAIGDYIAGTNHTLPTGGTARFFSALSVDDFRKKIQFVCYNRKGLFRVGKKVCEFANREGLTAHALSVSKRLTEE